MEHHHGRLGDPAITPFGNGVLRWFEVDDFDAAVERAGSPNAEIGMPRELEALFFAALRRALMVSLEGSCRIPFIGLRSA